MPVFGEYLNKSLKFNNTGIFSEEDYYLEAIGYINYGGINPKIYWEFEIITPSVRYHTDSSVVYSHCPHKLGFLLYTPTTQCKIRDGILNDAIWVEVGYDPSYGMCIKKIDQNTSTEYVAIFDDPNQEILVNTGDVIGFEIDVSGGLLNKFYINGVEQVLSDTGYTNINSWTPVTYIRPYACLYNAPYVSESSSLSDADPKQEFSSIRYNSARADFKYGPSSGYAPISLGNPRSETRPAILSTYRYNLSDTATLTPTITIPTGSIVWTSITWIDSSSSPSFSKLGELTIDLSASVALSDYHIIDDNGFVLWSTSWKDLNFYTSNIPVQLRNDKTYYLVIGVDMWSVDSDYSRIWTNQGASGGGTYIMSMSITPV